MVANRIAVYDEFRAQLAELKDHNGSLVFDYESPKGNRDARSHVYKLRQTKAAVEKARKDEKAASLEYGRRVDEQAKEISAEIEAMIEVHQRPLDEIEQREKDRQSKHLARLEQMRALATPSNEPLTVKQLRDRLADLESYALGAHWEEFEVDAARAKDEGVSALRSQIAAREKWEADQADLARLREEQVRREREEREARIAKEAEERATRQAEERAKAEREAGERRELELKLTAERAEREKVEAEQRAARAALEAEERVRRQAADEAARAKAEQEKREANKRHVAKINRAATDALMAGGVDLVTAELVVDLIASRKIPNVTIAY